MELALYGILTSIFWASSVTVLLPFLILLKYNKILRDKYFSYVYVKSFDLYFESRVLPLRKKAFELLNGKLSGRDVTKPLKVLEIGIASGYNLQFYPENSHLTALDMNVNFDSYFERNQKKYSQIVYEKTVISVAENMKDIDDCSMDLVISTYVLCSVRSVNDALKEIKRVLKPGGIFFFLDHVSYPKSDWRFTIQKLTQPLWTIYCNGCQIIRDIDEEVIKNSGFQDVVCKKASSKLIMYLKPQIYGLATK